MTGDDSTDGEDGTEDTNDEGTRFSRERLEAEADRAIDGFDRGLVDVLSWLLDTETRARIYIELRSSPGTTSDEVAEGTGLYPSTVREALAELHEEGVVERTKRESSGAGNNPYEYTAIPPSQLVGDLVHRVQSELNAVINLDNHLGDGEDDETDAEPVRIEVRDDDEDEDDEE